MTPSQPTSSTLSVSFSTYRWIFLLLLTMLLTGCSNSWKQLYREHLVEAPEPLKAEGTPQVSVHWMGTAGLYVSDGNTSLFIDPFVSRYGLLRVGLGLRMPIREDLVDEWIQRVGAEAVTHVLVSHSHYDHSMDAPFFAERTGARLVGSESTLQIATGAGLSDGQQLLVEPGVPFEAGKFTITFLESRHGPALFGRVPYPGHVEEPLDPPAKARDYRLGATYSLLIEHPAGTFLHHGSAGVVPGMFDGISADVVLLGIAGRSDTREYVADVVDAVEAPRVVLTHFDDFFVPLDKPMKQLWFVKFKEFIQTTREYRPELVIETLPLGEEVTLLSGEAGEEVPAGVENSLPPEK